jgi:AcrR family transcriptional regulator
MRAAKKHTEIRQEQIARAALKLLGRKGWQHLSLAAIAKEVGVVTSAVYRHFTGKDELLDAVFDLVHQSFQNSLQAARNSTEDPVDCLHAVLRNHVELIRGGVHVPRIILSEDVFIGSARHRKRVQAIYRNYLGEIAGIIADGQRQGLIREETAAETLSVMWLGLVQSPAILWLLGHGDFDLQSHCESAWKLFVAILRPTRPVKRA